MRKRSVNIIRSQPRTGYTKLPNAVANDDKLSARALGVLCYILTKPPNWRVIPAQLGSRFGMSYNVALTVLRELIGAGYVKRELLRDGRRIVGTRYLVADDPGLLSKLDQGDEPSSSDDCTQLPAENSRAPGKGEHRNLSISQHAEKRHTHKRKKDHKPPIPKPLPPAAQRMAAGLAGKTTAREGKRPSPDRGRWEVEVAKRIGPNGFDVLWTLPDTEVDHLCVRQKRGTLDDQTIARLRLIVPP